MGNIPDVNEGRGGKDMRRKKQVVGVSLDPALVERVLAQMATERRPSVSNMVEVLIERGLAAHMETAA